MSKPSETLKKELNEMYHVAFGNCEKCNYEKCSTYKKICACKFKFDYAAHIGEKYGEGKYKVLCVGKEGLYYHDKSSDTASILDAKNRHYQGTIYTLALLDGKEPRSISYNDLKEFKEIHQQFCLTNYFKCAFLGENQDPENSHGLPVTLNMKNHCYEILMKEIEILKPDLVIIQGKFTTKPFWNALEKENEAKAVYKNANNPNTSLYKYTFKNRSFYVLWSYHPATSHWNKALDDFRKAINAFQDDFANNESVI